jgi:GNAT superfamily N-acetyltransferase
MPPLRIEALSTELRGDCADLLAERYRRQRALEPLLPDVGDFAAHVPEEPGRVATRGGRVVAYLAGAVDGERAVVGFGGCAASEPEVLRDLYADLAAGWVADGCARHAVAVPAGAPELVDVWFRLAFGRQLTWGVREPEAGAPAFDGTIRRSTRDDLEAIVPHVRELADAGAASPSFSGLEATDNELRDEWSDTWDDDGFVHFVAERDGTLVGHLLLYRRPAADLRVPPDSIDIGHATTLPELQGTGVGSALTTHALDWAAGEGLRAVTVDWRDVNLSASRFWTSRAFRPQYFRLYRAVP